MSTLANPTCRAVTGLSSWRVWLALLGLLTWNALATCSTADIGGARMGANPSTTAATMKVSIGLGGVWKIGHVTPLKVELPGQWELSPRTIEVQTFDGDGVSVTYRHPINRGPIPESSTPTSGFRTHWCTITIGRADRPVTVRVLDRAGNEIQSKVLSGNELGRPLPTIQPWIVAIGNSLGVEATNITQTDTGLPNFTTTVLTSAADLPDEWRGLSACDLLILATSPGTAPVAGDAPAKDAPPSSTIEEVKPVVDSLTPAQWYAIEDWCQHGGTIVLSLGKYASELPGDAPLTAFLPGPVLDHLTNIDSGTLESATATKIRLSPISAVRFGAVRGKVELAMVDNSARRFPWWVRYSMGKGMLHCIASDLDQPVLKSWPDRRLVWDKLLVSFWSREQRNDSASSERSVSGSSFLGYEDLIGQLRATLDYFPTARVFSFGAITGILAVLLILIGPVDYWLSVRWLRRPSFSWIFTGMILLLSCAGLIWLHGASRPQELLLNSAQVVDFLPSQRRVLVDSWTHMYSSRARTVDASLKFADGAESVRLDWQGLPGKGLGGMESNLLTDQNMPRYDIDVVHANDTDNADMTGSMLGVGIPASGTKCLFATWSSRFEPQGESQLHELKGIDQIQGRLVNPLPYEILKPVLYYHNWSYSLPSRLRPGEEIAITYEMVPKDLMRRLNKRQVVDSKDVLTSWSQEDRQSIDRLLEIMMFYKASGGVDYTKLKHRFQPRMDISNVLALDHAVLYGQLRAPLGQVAFADEAIENTKHESTSTWCRVLLPVVRGEE